MSRLSFKSFCIEFYILAMVRAELSKEPDLIANALVPLLVGGILVSSLVSLYFIPALYSALFAKGR